MLAGVAALALAYLIGSIPSGYLAARAVTGTDIRAQGSGATGATNARRLLGTRWGVGVALFDIAKGVVAVLLARALTGGDAWPALAGLVAVAGHCWPVWLGFRGGKGVATGLGMVLALAWPAGLGTAAVWLLGALATRISSAGALLACIAAPFLVWAAAGPRPALATGIGTAIIVVRHDANIRRLLAGTEPRIGRSR